VSNTTFSPIHLVPEGLAMLACRCLIPDDWVKVPVPDERYDFSNPTVFLPLLVCMAPYGAVVFTVAARPAFDDGSVQDWAEYLATQNNLQVETIREARIDRMPCVLVDATMPSDAGAMRSRSVFLEDGRRLYNIGTLAPEAIWASVAPDFDRLLGSFRLDEVQGLTAAPVRLMTSEPAIDLSQETTPPANAEAPREHVVPDESTAASDTPPETSGGEAMPDDRPTQPADVALADDASTLDQEHPINASFRDNGVGLVPRVLAVSIDEKFATVGAGAIESIFRVPFGWHVIDDGKRTLVFDPNGGVQINFDLRHVPSGDLADYLRQIAQSLAQESPAARFLELEILGMPCLGVRDLLVDGERLDQAYLARASHREGLALICRVTADRDNITRAMNTAEVIITSLEGPPG
jgi:hypothetical protein